MNHRLRACLLALVLAGAAHAQGLLGIGAAPKAAPAGAPGAVRADAPDEAYPARLRAIREIAARFPGRISAAGHQYREMGLFAGIYMQTLWQHESGRDELSIWYWVNYNLTLAPRAYMSEYLANPAEPYDQSAWVKAHPTHDPAHAPMTTADHCRVWKEYYKACDEATADLKSLNPLRKLRGLYNQRVTVNKKLWRAHTSSIRYSLWQHQEQFAQPGIPEGELAFWRGWIKLVFLSEKISPSTTDLLLKPLLNATMPPCSPLGTEGCSAGDQPALRKAFLAWLMRGKVDQQEFLAVFAGKPAGEGARLAYAAGPVAKTPPAPKQGSALAALAPLKDPDVSARPDPANDLEPTVVALLDGVWRRVRAAQR